MVSGRGKYIFRALVAKQTHYSCDAIADCRHIYCDYTFRVYNSLVVINQVHLYVLFLYIIITIYIQFNIDCNEMYRVTIPFRVYSSLFGLININIHI